LSGVGLAREGIREVVRQFLAVYNKHESQVSVMGMYRVILVGRQQGTVRQKSPLFCLYAARFLITLFHLIYISSFAYACKNQGFYWWRFRSEISPNRKIRKGHL